MRTDEFLGVGWAFPVGLDDAGATVVRQYEDDVKEACKIILGTALGERVMRPDFGCAAHELLFEPADAGLPGKIEFYVSQALKKWEPRISIKLVKAVLEKERVLVDVEYVVLATNTEDNFVYPFFKKELP